MPYNLPFLLERNDFSSFHLTGVFLPHSIFKFIFFKLLNRLTQFQESFNLAQLSITKDVTD